MTRTPSELFHERPRPCRSRTPTEPLARDHRTSRCEANANGTYAIKYGDGSTFSKVDAEHVSACKPPGKAKGKGGKGKQ